MKKQILILCTAVLMLVGGLIQADVFKGGKAAIFLRDGDIVIGKVVDISRTRLVLELENGTEIKLSHIWMINFVDRQWDFPQEREQLKIPKHFVFRKNGDIISGKIVDFSSRLRVFEFETGENVGIDSVKRIYFMNKVPPSFKERLKEKIIKKKS